MRTACRGRAASGKFAAPAFAGRGTPFAVRTGRHARDFSRPETAEVSGRLMKDVLVGLEGRRLDLGALELDVLFELLLGFADVALVFEDGRERLGDELFVERLHVEERERPGPVEGLADARRLLQVELPDAVHDGDDVGGEALGDAVDLQAHDLELLRAIREVDEEMQAAALQRVGHLARVVAGEDDEREVKRADRAELGYAHLEVRQDFQQKRLELGVRLVDLVDQEDARVLRADGAQQRPRQDEAVAEEDVVLARDPVDRLAERTRAADHLADLVLQDLRVEKLLRVLPLVEGLRLVEALVALEANQLVAERAGQHLRELRLADAGGSLDEDRLPHLRREVDDRPDRVARDVLSGREPLDDVVYRLEHAAGSPGTAVGKSRDANTRVLARQSNARPRSVSTRGDGAPATVRSQIGRASC